MVSINHNQNKLKLILLDLGRAEIPNLELDKTLREKILQITFKYHIVLKNLGRRAFNQRSLLNIIKSNNKSHQLNTDIKYPLISMIQGFAHIFGNQYSNLFITITNDDKININNMNNYGDKIQYIIKKINDYKMPDNIINLKPIIGLS